MAIALWLGTLAGGALVPGTLLDTITIVLAAALGAAAVTPRVRDGIATAALLALLVLAGAARGAAHHAVVRAARSQVVEPALYRLVARVATPPTRAGGAPAAIVEIDAATPPLPRGARLRARLPEGCDLEWGDRARLVSWLQAPRAPRNPGAADERERAAAAAVAADARVLVARRLETGEPSWPRATVARWRRAVERSLGDGLEPATRALVIPLVTGDRSDLPTDLAAAFRASGLVHLLALSGLHVTWMASVAAALCAALGGGVRVRAGASAACALFYLGIAGPLPSLARAVATELAAAAARLAGRPLDPVQALALSAVLGLAIAPGWAADLGFQLSCAATLGLVTIAPGIAERCGRGRALVQPWLTTAAAQATALPLLVARMHAASWVAPLANLLAVPVSGLLLAAAWIAAVADLALPGSAGIWFRACDGLAALLQAITERAAALPIALLATGAEPGVPILAGAGATLLAVALAPQRALEARRRPTHPARAAAAVVGGTLVLVATVRGTLAAPLAPPAGACWLVVLDVDQGDAIALGFDRQWWLVDAGPRSDRADAGESRVVPFLRWAGVRRLATLVLTHDDSDHTGGAIAVRRDLAVDRVVAPAAEAAAVLRRRFGAVAAARGDTLRRGPAVAVLWPPALEAARDPRTKAADAPARRPGDDNHLGLVLEIACGGERALLTADVDHAAEDSLALDAPLAVLKVAHHGSRTSSSAGFLARARPGLAIVSCGRRNAFGHPHPEVIARLDAAGAHVRRTDRDGAVWIELRADGVREIDWRAPPARVRASRGGGAAGAPARP